MTQCLSNDDLGEFSGLNGMNDVEKGDDSVEMLLQGLLGDIGDEMNDTKHKVVRKDSKLKEKKKVESNDEIEKKDNDYETLMRLFDDDERVDEEEDYVPKEKNKDKKKSKNKEKNNEKGREKESKRKKRDVKAPTKKDLFVTSSNHSLLLREAKIILPKRKNTIPKNFINDVIKKIKARVNSLDIPTPDKNQNTPETNPSDNFTLDQLLNNDKQSLEINEPQIQPIILNKTVNEEINFNSDEDENNEQPTNQNFTEEILSENIDMFNDLFGEDNTKEIIGDLFYHDPITSTLELENDDASPSNARKRKRENDDQTDNFQLKRQKIV